ncbi:unnamed protein product (macronuclear) [Paramecium tetraurelia]|uniref:MORN repeat protein n=1 Tax=Paramecium tetraurelia TaxID=5888 RepID=A0EHQ3_PARTE|nr:uncharacterized protein GSPATT00027170001 [Paramecium tetraurelia]CAK94844.1 unnamed protein product [Paramecium tetraurelia]|eukprot:XP_001462217.1 hypothetical protein (macronuclear) [Paramecium tetraurelia strain d4-2]
MIISQGHNTPQCKSICLVYLDYFSRLQVTINEHINSDVDVKKLYDSIDRKVPFRNLQNGFYRGETDGAQPKGKGEWISKDGYSYKVGFWQNNCLQGKGLTLYCVYDTQQITHYECYYGNFNKGKPQGYGKLKATNNKSYEGQWENGQMNGQGSIYIENSYYIKGQFKNNQLSGQGEIESKDQNYYWKMVGTFIEPNRFKGDITYKTGKYIGSAIYEENQWQMHEQGSFIWDDESYYKGGFSYNQREGYAISKFGNEDQQELVWKNDQKYGKVEHT